MIDYAKLQNGSDVRGVAMSGIPGEEVNLTPEAAGVIAAAFVRWLANKKDKMPQALTIGVGRDSRLSGPELQRAVMIGLTNAGARAADCAMASTPAMFMSTVLEDSRFDGAIMITASHLPWNRNGLKFFTDAGGLESADIKALLALAGQETALPMQKGERFTYDIMTPYCSHLRRRIIDGVGAGERPLEGLRIAVDAGNGAGGFFASSVLEPLGADISASVYLEPDGHFPNHIPNPENKEAMDCIRGVVLQNRCDLGLIFDTDVDRAGAVDHEGAELCRNRLIALMSAIVAEEAPHSTIVTDSVTSDPLHDFIEGRLGCTHHRFKRGYKNVINEAIRLNAEGHPCLLAMETSGHGALRENYFLDDGAYLSAKLVIRYAQLRREGKDFSDLLEGLREPLEALELRFPLPRESFRTSGEAVLAALEQYAATQPDWQLAPSNYEGLRYSVPAHGGWLLLRLSLHDPLMPLNIESDRAGGADAILRELSPFLRSRPELDCSPLDR